MKGTALITGGAQRIGRAICLKLADLGYSIALHYHQSKSEAQKTAEEIRKRRGTCELFACDLTNDKEVSSLIRAVADRFSDLNVLVNNASIFEKSSLKTVTPKVFDRDFAVHLKAPLILSRDFAQICQKGQIINILDTNITKTQTTYFSYLLAKKGLAEFTKLAAQELAPHIRVNGVAPGFILPPEDKKESEMKQRLSQIPLSKKGKVEEIS